MDPNQPCIGWLISPIDQHRNDIGFSLGKHTEIPYCILIIGLDRNLFVYEWNLFPRRSNAKAVLWMLGFLWRVLLFFLLSDFFPSSLGGKILPYILT